MSDKLKFPRGFFWGAATAAHQVEGNNHNDWSEWELKNSEKLAAEAGKKWEKWQQEKFPEMFEAQNYISGQACEHYNLFEKDFDIAKNLGHNAHRFSIEWSRIEPEEGKFNEEAIEHYRKVVKALKVRGMEPFVTLWHWSMPLWMRDMGGAHSAKFPYYFSRYSGFMAEKLKKDVRFWITLNEPTSHIAAGYFAGLFPPKKKNIFLALKAYRNLSKAHILAFEKIHEVEKNAQVGFANILNIFKPANQRSMLDRLSTRLAQFFGNKLFLKLIKNKQDFLTVQYYYYFTISFPAKYTMKGELNSDLGWSIKPKGIYHSLKKLQKYNLPIYITENGIADAKDENREKFIKEHLFYVHKAISEGVDVRGYFYWSLLDNFEWDKGFWPRFGLVEIDYKTLERKIRPSALEYAKICKSNEMEIA